MALIEMDFMNSGSGGNAYHINIAHKTQNATTIYYSVSEISSEDVYSYVEPTTDYFTASDYGGIFDKTIQLSSSLSVRLHSSGYNNAYFLADIIKNGTTVSADNQVALPYLASSSRRLDLIYGFNFVVSS